MLRRLVLGLVLLTATLFVLATPTRAGGWVAVTLDSLPVKVRAGESLHLGFTVRQHAVRPVDDAEPVLFARSRETGESVHADARKEGPAGHYLVDVTFPSTGTWEWGVDPKPWPVVHFEPLTVLPAAAETNAPSATGWWFVIPALFLPLGLVLAIRGERLVRRAGVTIGFLGLVGLVVILWPLPTGATGSARPDAEYARALFVAKGCPACHLHSTISTVVHGPVAGPNLTDYRPEPEFLRRWLRAPQAVRPDTEMPDVGLSETEIEALIAFLDAGSRR